MKLFKNWWLLSLKGILAIIFGIIVLALRKETYSKLETIFGEIKFNLPMLNVPRIAPYFGLVIIVSGILIISGAITHKKSNQRWRWWLVEGSLDFMFGTFLIILAFFKPNYVGAIMIQIMALWITLIGTMQIISAFRLRDNMQNWWILLFTGLFSIMIGILLFINPFTGTNIGNLAVIGLFTILFGVLIVFISKKLKDVYA